MTTTCPRCHAQVPTGRFEACPRCLLEADLPPATLGGVIELQEEIGRGGMGVVYRARHLRLGRAVAVKLLPEALAAQPEFQARFEREARALAMLNHPGIVAVHDFGREGSQSYLVMEFVEGEPVSRLIPLPASRAIDVAAQVCDALAYAHRQGIVHRDIKPENILIDAAGRAKVTDFGIARLVGGGAGAWTVTAPDVAIGTPHYIAPEALAGAPPDPRMDIYSLGVLLYQMTTGRLPVGHFDPAPAPLAAVVNRALAADPARRYPDADAMRRDIDAARARPAGAPGQDALPVDERNWVRVVALLQSISTATALWAFLVSVTPRVIEPGARLPLIMVGDYTLPDGRIVSRARFETWWTLAALATFAVAITGYGLLRRHWRREGLERHEPDRPVRESRRVFLWGVVANVVYGLRLLLDGMGRLTWARPYQPLVGGAIEVMALYCFWTALLHAWRIDRPFRREPRVWLGFALALVPPAIDLVRTLATWQP